MSVYNDALSSYIADLFARDTALEGVRNAIPQKGLPAIYIQPEEGRFLQILVRLCEARKALEIGSLGGYSGAWIARGLMPGGRLITLEVDPRHAQVAREHFAHLGLAGQVEVRQGDAHQLLKDLIEEAPFDFIFIDAEKSGYPAYLDWAIEHVRLGGVIAAHNAFQNGAVINPGSNSTARLIDSFNRKSANDPRLMCTIFPAGDGTLVALKIR